MKVVLVGTDLMIGSRIAAAADAAEVAFARVDEPNELANLDRDDLVLVDWANRTTGWEEPLIALSASAAPPRLRLFGSHKDLDAHAAAAAAGLGPMVARSKLVARLHALIRGDR